MIVEVVLAVGLAVIVMIIVDVDNQTSQYGLIT
jgi:hypothetical protein